MKINQYLNRINYHGPRTPTLEALHALQWAHLTTVPFENLSIHANEPIVLNDEALFDKIVRRGRGGFCYEANGLFASLLRELGFDVMKLSARVANAEGVFGPEFDHMTLLVRLEQRWLVDVGFGDSFHYPLLLDERGDQPQGRRSYRIEDEGETLLLLQKENDSQWLPQYRFTLTAREYPEYEAMCHYHQTSPESHFTRNIICSKATAAGRVTVSGLRLVVTNADGTREETTLSGEDELLIVLHERFDISLPNGVRLGAKAPVG